MLILLGIYLPIPANYLSGATDQLLRGCDIRVSGIVKFTAIYACNSASLAECRPVSIILCSCQFQFVYPKCHPLKIN